ncbi:hypothetical protein BFL43_03815 [Williamsia sp. 1135]|nr:hypothetical protein BFL43_03815 [Williamsia sp. 1135]
MDSPPPGSDSALLSSIPTPSVAGSSSSLDETPAEDDSDVDDVGLVAPPAVAGLVEIGVKELSSAAAIATGPTASTAAAKPDEAMMRLVRPNRLIDDLVTSSLFMSAVDNHRV